MNWMRGPALVVIWVLCAAAALLGLAWLPCAMLVGSPRAHRIALALDQVANATTGGSEDQTVSTRAALAEVEGKRWARALCWLLDRADPGHCERCRANKP